MRLLVAAYRLRMAVYYLSVLTFVAFTWLSAVTPNQQLKQTLLVAALASIGVFILTILLVFSGKKLRPSHNQVAVAAPVAGRWLGLNSPQDKVPSHGVHTLGQTYAIDLIHDPDGTGRRPLSRGLGMHPPQDFVSYGQPVFAVVCHLQRGSVSFKIGQHVVAGQQVGLCGNSGNSSEPHVHAQLMDRANPNTAIGIPMAFKDTTIDDGPISGPTLPANGQAMNAPAASLSKIQ